MIYNESCGAYRHVSCKEEWRRRFSQLRFFFTSAFFDTSYVPFLIKRESFDIADSRAQN